LEDGDERGGGENEEGVLVLVEEPEEEGRAGGGKEEEDWTTVVLEEGDRVGGVAGNETTDGGSAGNEKSTKSFSLGGVKGFGGDGELLLGLSRLMGGGLVMWGGGIIAAFLFHGDMLFRNPSHKFTLDC
jgi:hypothetical protein